MELSELIQLIESFGVGCESAELLQENDAAGKLIFNATLTGGKGTQKRKFNVTVSEPTREYLFQAVKMAMQRIVREAVFAKL